MRTLIYKRTHVGDPDPDGRFGIRDCMGRVRRRAFDAVIGVGGMGNDARDHGIDGKLNWIGIGPHKRPHSERGPLVTFDHFLYLEADGPDLSTIAPALADRFYSRGARVVFDNFDDAEQAEIDRLLEMAEHSPPSRVLRLNRPRVVCHRRRCC